MNMSWDFATAKLSPDFVIVSMVSLDQTSIDSSRGLSSLSLVHIIGQNYASNLLSDKKSIIQPKKRNILF